MDNLTKSPNVTETIEDKEKKHKHRRGDPIPRCLYGPQKGSKWHEQREKWSSLADPRALGRRETNRKRYKVEITPKNNNPYTAYYVSKQE